jgi:hypothetical protein
MKSVLLAAAVVLALAAPRLAGAVEDPPKVLTQAHSHNDYEQKRPLLDALDCGFDSVEADIFLVDGQLLVNHLPVFFNPERTLQKLYLDPLAARVRQNGGRVYAHGPSFWLLIDIKSDANRTYAALREVLNNYTNMLTRFVGTNVYTNAVTVIISGNRPRAALAAAEVRYAACDGFLADAEQHAPTSLVPWISEDWTRHFQWRGNGPMPDAERRQLRGFVQAAHQSGQLIRFWGAPNREPIWQEQYAAGVDLLNADDLPALKNFLLMRQPR